MLLTLVRHGQTPSNVLGLLDTGIPGPGLTELGHRQAAALVDAFVERPVDALYVSRLIRTHHTAEPLATARRLEPVELPGIHEIGAGSLEMRGDRESMQAYLGTIHAWSAEGLHVAMPGGEDGHTFFDRFDAGVARAADGADHAVVVSHGAAIRVWVAERAQNIGHSFVVDHDLPNTGIVELEGDPDSGWRLLRWLGDPVDPHGADVHSAA